MRNSVTRLVLATMVAAIAASPASAREEKATRKPNSSASAVVRQCETTDGSPVDLEYVTTFKTFAKGAVRAFVTDTYGEPVCCSSHLIIYVPKKSEEGPGEASCFHIASSRDGLGFMSVGLDQAKASYNPKEGLSLTIPFGFYGDGIKNSSKNFTVVINQEKETVVVK